MNEILERIKEAYHFKTDAEVADFLDINPSTLSMQKNRGRLDLKRIIERCNDLNKNWLLDGKGEKRAVDGTKDQPPIPVYSSLNIKNKKPDFSTSPKAGNIYADFSNEIDGFPASDRLIGYVNSGDGMAPTVKENDIAVINLDVDPAHDGIFLIASSQEVSLRRLQKEQEKLIAQSMNGKDSPIEISVSETYHCIGELIWILRRV
ncbi:LexA family transcriptional regulator [Fodinibius sp.]|uniref:LexA family transcriptional regulator n=1 Tax=Fodinibius sp. TaxID=1872440 RepID=UPI002ACEC717|nr:LexA family transcriptional regulator [Fodinibius sp.]MDZ7659857.1 LexA family transcriptional regulator [Fodinibius sp.]